MASNKSCLNVGEKCSECGLETTTTEEQQQQHTSSGRQLICPKCSDFLACQQTWCKGQMRALEMTLKCHCQIGPKRTGEEGMRGEEQGEKQGRERKEEVGEKKRRGEEREREEGRGQQEKRERHAPAPHMYQPNSTFVRNLLSNTAAGEKKKHQCKHNDTTRNEMKSKKTKGKDCTSV